MPTETLNRLIRQFLVHSFLYYRLDESLISDQQYDELAQGLGKSLTTNAVSYTHLRAHET